MPPLSSVGNTCHKQLSDHELTVADRPKAVCRGGFLNGRLMPEIARLT